MVKEERYELPRALVDTLGDRNVVFELHAISFSHYCNKARWALRLCGVPYEERGYLPLQHIAPVVRLLRRFRAAPAPPTASSKSPAATPVLAVWRAAGANGGDGGERAPLGLVSNSALISRYAALRAAALGDPRPSRALYGCVLRVEPVVADDAAGDGGKCDGSTAERFAVVGGDSGDGKASSAYARVAALELRLSGALGVEARRVAYFYMLPVASLGGALFVKNSGNGALSPSWLRAWLWYGAGRLLLPRLLGVSAAAAAKGERRLLEEFDYLDGLIAAGTLPDADAAAAAKGEAIPDAALVSLATLAAPMLAPAPLQPGCWMPGLGEVPPPLRSLMEQLRARPAGKLALRLWELHYGDGGGNGGGGGDD